MGDSRAVLSANAGKEIKALSVDHKPLKEQDRIERSGGYVYQYHFGDQLRKKVSPNNELHLKRMQIAIPHRVFPGRLSVSRTVGDIDAKLPKYGGNPRVVVATPDIFSFDLEPNHDFIFLGSTSTGNARRRRIRQADQRRSLPKRVDNL